MMDHFDAKRGMVKQLLDMLKNHAANEVSNGLQKPEGEGDMHGIQAEKVEVLPEHEMDMPTPEHDVVTHEMNEGGTVPDPSDGEPDPNGNAKRQADANYGGDPDMAKKQADANGYADGGYADAESEPPSMFASFLGKRKKK